MKIINSNPPNIDELDSKFNIRGKPIIFTYGDIIYNPLNVFVSPELMSHEEVHSVRQTNDRASIELWWEKYLIDPEFRLNEEVLAHRAEFKKYCETHKDRNNQNLFLNGISQRLSSSMYGNMLTVNKARKKITGG